MKSETINVLSFYDIAQFPFVYKLWILIESLEDVIIWSPSGMEILIDIAKLQNYLLNIQSLFQARSIHVFLKQLSLLGFERIPYTPSTKYDKSIFSFKSQYFVQQCPELLCKFHFETNDSQRSNSANKKVTEYLNSICSKRDRCFENVGYLTKVEKSRILFATNLLYSSVKEKLITHMKFADNKARNDNRAPFNTFLTPHASVMVFPENPEYAGYYGNIIINQIQKFFGKFLPIYKNPSNDSNTNTATEAKINDGTVVGNIQLNLSLNDKKTYSPIKRQTDESDKMNSTTSLLTLEQVCDGNDETIPYNVIVSFKQMDTKSPNTTLTGTENEIVTTIANGNNTDANQKPNLNFMKFNGLDVEFKNFREHPENNDRYNETKNLRVDLSDTDSGSREFINNSFNAKTLNIITKNVESVTSDSSCKLNKLVIPSNVSELKFDEFQTPHEQNSDVCEDSTPIVDLNVQNTEYNELNTYLDVSNSNNELVTFLETKNQNNNDFNEFLEKGSLYDTDPKNVMVDLNPTDIGNFEKTEDNNNVAMELIESDRTGIEFSSHLENDKFYNPNNVIVNCNQTEDDSFEINIDLSGTDLNVQDKMDQEMDSGEISNFNSNYVIFETNDFTDNVFKNIPINPVVNQNDIVASECQQQPNNLDFKNFFRQYESVDYLFDS